MSLEERVAVLEASRDDTKADVAAIIAAIAEIRTQLADEVRRLTDKLSARPSWALMILISGMATAIGILGTALLSTP